MEKHLIIFDQTTVYSISDYTQATAVVTNDSFMICTLEHALISLTAIGIDCTYIVDYINKNN